MNVPESDMRKMLSTLVDAIARQVRSCIDDASLSIYHDRYVLHPNFSLHYSVDRSQLNFPTEEHSETTCDPGSLERLVLTPVRAGQVFKTIAGCFPDDSDHHDELEKFIHVVAMDVACKPSDASSRSVAKHLDVVIADFKGRELDYKVKVWLRGITLAEDLIKVSEDLIFRRPNRMDFQERIPARMVDYAHALHVKTYFSCIVDLRIKTKAPFGAQRFVDKIVTALRLYRLGAVAASRLDMAAESFSMFAQFSIGDPRRDGDLQYELKESDSIILSEFLDEITKHLPSHIEQLPSVPDFLTTAVQWYDQALFRSFPPEAVIASAVASLEALFLQGVQAEVTYRLAQRVAGLLRCFGFAPLEVRTSVTQAYGVRSKYVHGDQQEKKWGRPRLNVLAQTACEYARVSILVFCQLGASPSRSDLLLLLDDSLLDDDSLDKLKAALGAIKMTSAGRPANSSA